MRAVDSDVYVSRGLVEMLMQMADHSDPSKQTIKLIAEDADELDCDVDGDEVFTEFYMPMAGSSVEFVFGFDLGLPNGQSDAVFISHPEGDRDVRLSDDLHRIIFVATPPWKPDESLFAYTRDGHKLNIELVDVEPRTDLPLELEEL